MAERKRPGLPQLKIRSTSDPANQGLKQLPNLPKTMTVKKYVGDELKEFAISFDDFKNSLGELLGSGGYGTVKKWLHTPSSTTFAVKMVEDKHLYEAKKGELMDIEIGKKIGEACPYLVKFYGALHADSHVWIFSELMDTSLDQFYKKAYKKSIEIPELFLSKIAFSVLKGLEFMKSLNLMHRDIKPSNILLNYDGDIKLCDFGISGITADSFFKTVIGTPPYMAPERRDVPVDGYTIKADVWSLGISLIEISNGAQPFENLKTIVVYLSITSDELPKLKLQREDKYLESFINKCLIKNPNERGSCDELLNDRFIKKYEQMDNDLEFIKQVIDQVNDGSS